MNNFWKWILGIVIVLVVLFGLGVGARLLTRSFLPETSIAVDGFAHPMMFGLDKYGDVDGFRGQVVVGRGGLGSCGGFFHTGRGFMAFGWLIPLALVALVIYGGYRLGFRRGQDNGASLPSAGVSAARACTKCGHQVQEGWTHCANCGKKL